MLIELQEWYKLNAIHLHCEVGSMAKFEIPQSPPTVNKTIRFPSDLVQGVEGAIQGKDCTFSAFVIAAVRSALADLQDEK